MTIETGRKVVSGAKLLTVIGSLGVAACGGGGGASDDAPPAIREALTFLEPIELSNDEYVTSLGVVDFLGGFTSGFGTTLDCSDDDNFSPKPFFEVRWRNAASGESGEATSIIVCYNTGTIFGTGIRSRWWTDFIALELGSNVFEFEVFDNGRLVGRNRVEVFRRDGQPPSVSYVFPEPGGEDVPIDARLLVLFSEAMLESSLGDADWVLSSSDGTELSGVRTWEAGQHSWLLRPDAALAPNTTYRVSLSKHVEDHYRSELAEDFQWQFTTGANADSSPPQVVGQWPAAPCTCSPPSTRIMLEFDEPLHPDTVTPSILEITGASQGAVAGTTVYHGRILEFVPDSLLSANESYAVTVANVSDLNGNSAVPPGLDFATDDGGMQGSWQVLASLPIDLTGAVMASDGVSVFIFGDAGFSGMFTGLQGFVYQTGTGEWQRTSELLTTAATTPDTRSSPSIVWDGSDLIVFGGYEAQSRPQNDGGRYRPASDIWETLYASWWDSARMSYPHLLGLGGHSAIWTGEQMLIWGGEYAASPLPAPINRGWTYSPASDTWQIMGPAPTVDDSYNLIADAAAPQGRSGHSAVWTGTQMLIWGGIDATGQPLSDGGRYDPSSDSWQPSSVVDAPAASAVAKAVWTDSTMLVWNGGQPELETMVGEPMRRIYLHRYEPVADLWSSSQSGWEPVFSSETNFFLLQVGSASVAIGIEQAAAGNSSGRELAAYVYDPNTDRWTIGARQSVQNCTLDAATVHLGQVFASCASQVYVFSP